MLLARQNNHNRIEHLIGEMCTPLASSHVEVNGGGGGGEGGVTYAQNRAVKVALAARSQAVGSLRELHLLPHAQRVRHPQPIWQLINGGFLQQRMLFFSYSGTYAATYQFAVCYANVSASCRTCRLAGMYILYRCVWCQHSASLGSLHTAWHTLVVGV